MRRWGTADEERQGQVFRGGNVFPRLEDVVWTGELHDTCVLLGGERTD